MSAKRYHHGDLKNALIRAGGEILTQEGLGALSLRKVAARAGVSHSAPYAHFADKRALVAAVLTESVRRLKTSLEAAVAANADHPERLLIEIAAAYVDFALTNPAEFKIMFSGVLESQAEFPELDAHIRSSYALLEDVVARLQSAGLLRPGPADILALSIWSLVHGLTSLLLEGQISHRILDAYPLRELLCRVLSQVTLRDINHRVLESTECN